MTMTAERNGSCSIAVALLDLVEGEDEADPELVAALAEGLALVEEVDTGNGVSVKQFKRVGQKDDRDH
jgi:hypothetical protein